MIFLLLQVQRLACPVDFAFLEFIQQQNLLPGRGKSGGEYHSIRFYVHGGDTGGQQVEFRLKANGIFRTGPTLDIRANEWTEVVIPLDAATFVDPSNIDELIWRKKTTGPMPTFYIDEIMLLGDGPADPVAGTYPVR